MPEGDTVWRACRRLHGLLAGEQLRKAEFRVPSLAVTDLTGVTVLDVTPRGKHQLFRFGQRLDPAHPLPDGGRLADLPERPSLERWSRPRDPSRPGHGGHGCGGLPTAGGRAAARRPTRTRWWDTWARICSARTGIETKPCAGSGPSPDVSIGEALLDQRNLAGLGTFYRSELLFLQGLHPRTPVSDVATLPRVVQRAYLLINANKVRAEQSTTGDLRQGRRTYVFERPGQPCRRCATSIRTEEFGPPGQERRSYWCPRCQPER